MPIERFLAAAATAFGRRPEIADRFDTRWRGLRGRRNGLIYLPNCRWVHGRGLAEPIMLVQPEPELRLRLHLLEPGRWDRPHFRALGTLEVGIVLWRSGARLFHRLLAAEGWHWPVGESG